MFLTAVSYKEAVKWHKKVRIKQKIMARLKEGKLYRDVAFWHREFSVYRDRQSLKELLRACLIFVVGGRIENFFWKRHFVEERKKIIRMFMPKENEILYHWASVEFVKDIQKKGLIPGRAYQYVYLTDDPKYMENAGYLYGKTILYGRDTTYVALEIEVKELIKSEAVYQILDEHEFVVKRVPPQFIRPIYLEKSVDVNGQTML